ncbi:MAG TPA: DNA repair protein RadA, partial [Thermoanaerobaculia bacterium]|nr:DNA repair protein RadA [Thermoanaerobaculia bacterium]
MVKPRSRKPRTQFVCQGCGYASPRWLGRCPDCDAWDSFVEETAAPARPEGGAGGGRAARAVPLAAVEEEAAIRFGSGMPLLDRVLGGGVVAGGAVLLAGEPGIGKSTLLLQLAEALARGGRRVLYASAEESTRQLRLRAERLGCGHAGLLVAGETSVEAVLATAAQEKPEALFVDSIQALHSEELGGLPGSVGQVRTCAEKLVEHAKRTDCAVFLVGHVTKEGSIAGPKSLEHLVDTVLAFEAEGGADHRLLRAAKNRFGPAGEVALFEMHDSGLAEVADPSRVLLAQRRPEAPGSAVAATMHGSRPLLVEVQALVHASELPTPRRVALGLDGARVALLQAVLERFAGASFAARDVYLNVVGGLRLEEPAVDLGVAGALLSAIGERPLPGQAAFFGEVGLLGEV